jgi:hypothetical protein
VEATESTSARPPTIYASIVTKLQDEFTIPLPVSKGSFACLDAIATVGWNVETTEPDRIVAKIGVGVTRNPSKIELLLSESGDQTVVRLNGSIWGVGPLQRRHLDAELRRLREAIELCARAEGAA